MSKTLKHSAMGGDAKIIAAASISPGEPIKTEDYLEKFQDFLSEEFISTVSHMDIRQRFSVVRNFLQVASGEADRTLSHSTAAMAAQAIEGCLDQNGIQPGEIDTLIAVTNTPDRQLPGSAYEIVHQFGHRLRPDLRVINLSHAGCSGLVKGIDLATVLVESGASRMVAISASESHTAFMEPFGRERHLTYREIGGGGSPERELVKTHRMMGSFLFGDGAAAVLVSRSDTNGIAFDRVAHLTNLEPDDLEILRMSQGGADTPDTRGFPLYEMAPSVPGRGAHYASRTLETLCPSEEPKGFDTGTIAKMGCFLIHTGSRKILNGICETLGIEPEDPRVASSYRVLRDHANLSSASVGVMLADLIRSAPFGDGLVISFGAGFSSSSAVMRYNQLS